MAADAAAAAAVPPAGGDVQLQAASSPVVLQLFSLQDVVSVGRHVPLEEALKPSITLTTVCSNNRP